MGWGRWGTRESLSAETWEMVGDADCCSRRRSPSPNPNLRLITSHPSSLLELKTICDVATAPRGCREFPTAQLVARTTFTNVSANENPLFFPEPPSLFCDADASRPILL